jgi:hypothetical protein
MLYGLLATTRRDGKKLGKQGFYITNNIAVSVGVIKEYESKYET